MMSYLGRFNYDFKGRYLLGFSIRRDGSSRFGTLFTLTTFGESHGAAVGGVVDGMYGLRPHEAALARGCKVTGATVHFVNEECDGGPILLQKAVDILPGDTPEVLQKRVMEQAEWKLLPQAVRMICDGEVQ